MAASETNNTPNYSTVLPAEEHGVTDWPGNPAYPKITSDITGAIPTNDWWSSLVYSYFGNSYSAPMFADPIVLQAQANGMDIGYTPTARIYKNDFGQQVKYEYTYHKDLSVGLSNLHADATKLADYSDWTVTASWQDDNSASVLEATFGHGMPFVYFTRQGNDSVSISLSKNNDNALGQPNATAKTFIMQHVDGYFTGQNINFDLPINAVGIGNTAEARISIDTNGDGTFDYVKTYNFIPLDDNQTTYEHYLQNESRGIGADSVGDLTNLNNATIKVEVWRAQGSGDIQIKNDAVINLPFDHLKVNGVDVASSVYFSNQGTLVSQMPVTGDITIGNASNNNIVSGWSGDGQIWYAHENVLGVTINGNNYGLFAPVGATWHTDNGLITSDLSGKDYFSVALLPDKSVATLDYFYQHAYAVVTDTKISYDYDQSTSAMTTDFNVTTNLKETGFSSDALISLFRHQWLNTDADLTNYIYQSARGEMKLMDGNHFETQLAFNGILPELPNMLTTAQSQAVYQAVDSEYKQLLGVADPIAAEDSYWSGKAMERLGELAKIADNVGHTAARDYFLTAMKNELQDWFNVGSNNADGSTDQQFYYNSEWGTLQAYPASFNTEREMNDHHFHYGYFVTAAATIAQFDPEWAQKWGGMVDLLIKDVANADHNDPRFPFLRNFDPYEGHSWASGHGAFLSGNNHESSSEAMNFASGVILWGAQTQDPEVRDLGIYLYTTELSAIQQYWFDVDNAVYPANFAHNAVGMVWGDGASYATWFSGEPEMIQGINYLPITAASLYLGSNVSDSKIDYAEMVANNHGVETEWRDIIWEYQAMFDPQSALAKFNAAGNFAMEEGESRSHVMNWINNLANLGQVETSILANNPFYAVFNNNGLITYTAYNATNAAITVTFTDGTHMQLAAKEFAAMNSQYSWSSIAGTVGEIHPPVVDPVNPPTTEPPVIPPVVVEPTLPPIVPPVETTPTSPVVDNSHTVIGTDQADTLIGIDLVNNHLIGLAGNDTLHGNQEVDTLEGGDGDDFLHGNGGDDILLGGNGADHLYGTIGDDKLTGGLGADFLVGGDGKDTYIYTSVNDSTTQAPDFVEHFERGQDKFDLSAMNVQFNDLAISNQDGFTHIKINNSNFDIKIPEIINFTHDDFIFSQSSTSVPVVPPVVEPIPVPVIPPVVEPTPVVPPVVEPTPPPVVDNSHTVTGTAQSETLVGTDPSNNHLIGLAGDDTLHGNQGTDLLEGGDGNDFLHGNGGNDILQGGSGNDFLYGGIGDDQLTGGAGKDFLVGGEGKDTYIYTSLNDSTTTAPDFVEHFEIGQDKFDFSAMNVQFSDLTISQKDGFTDITIGNNFDIRLPEIINLTQSDFNFSGSSSVPVPIIPPVQSPPVVVTTAPTDYDNHMQGGAGNDNLSGTVLSDWMEGNQGDDNLFGYAGNDKLYGGDGNDRLHGHEGDDRLDGGDGNDFLYGHQGNDTLTGGNGEDYLYGHEGNDILEGGAGKDLLVGAEGKDTYVYKTLNDSTVNAADLIENFTSHEDILDLSALHVNPQNVHIGQNLGHAVVTIADTSFSIDLIGVSSINIDDIRF